MYAKEIYCCLTFFHHTSLQLLFSISNEHGSGDSHYFMLTMAEKKFIFSNFPSFLYIFTVLKTGQMTFHLNDSQEVLVFPGHPRYLGGIFSPCVSRQAAHFMELTLSTVSQQTQHIWTFPLLLLSPKIYSEDGVRLACQESSLSNVCNGLDCFAHATLIFVIFHSNVFSF